MLATPEWGLAGAAVSPVLRHLAIDLPGLASLAGRYAVVAVAAFVGGVLADLQGKWKDALADRIDRLARSAVNRAERQHRDHVLSMIRSRNAGRFPQADFRVPDLDEVFCRIDLAAADPGDTPSGPLGRTPGESTGLSALDTLLDKREGALVAVLGGPGSGKTALLDHTAQLVCRAGRWRRRGVAIPLRAASIAPLLGGGNHVQLPELLGQVFPGDAGQLGSWFAGRLEHGDCVVLIDAFDEVDDAGRRDALARWIGRQADIYYKNDFVLASRPREFQEAMVRRADVLSVCGLGGSQAYAFLRSWNEAVTRRGRRRPGKNKIKAQDAADDLLDRIKRSPALNELAANPLILSLIAVADRMGDAIPRWRARVYRDILGELLARRPPGADGVPALGVIAFAMMRQQKDKLAEAELSPVIRQALGDSCNTSEVLARVSATGLLIRDADGYFGFAHRAFAEYLAAAHIRATGRVQVLAEHVADGGWREVTVLYASGATLPDRQRTASPDTGKAVIDPIVVACLESGTVRALALALDCEEHGADLSPRLRRLGGRLDPVAIVASEPAEQAEMAKVMLTRLLDAAMPTEAGGKVCVGFVPRWLYAAYARGEPDPGPRHAAAAAARSPEVPLRGARQADAEGMVEWANKLLGRQACRLPAPSEIRDPHVQRSLATASEMTTLCVWSREPQAAKPELIKVFGEDPYLVTGDALARQVADDLSRSAAVTHGLLALRAVTAVTAITDGLAHRGPAEQIRGENLDLIHDLRRTLALLTVLLRGNAALTGATEEKLAACMATAGNLRRLVRPSRADRADHPGAATAANRLAGELHELAGQLLSCGPPAWRALGLPAGIPVQPGPRRDVALPPTQAFGRSLSEVMAPSLARALSTVLQRGTSAGGWNAGFARVLCGQAALSPLAHLSVPPDDLKGRVNEAITRAAELTRGTAQTPQARLLRLRVLAGNDVSDAIAGHAPLTDQLATTCRLSVACAAAEASRLRNDDLATVLCEVAAGFTVLQRRADTESPHLAEAIVLAVA